MSCNDCLAFSRTQVPLLEFPLQALDSSGCNPQFSLCQWFICVHPAGLVWIASVIVGSPMLFVQQLEVSAPFTSIPHTKKE